MTVTIKTFFDQDTATFTHLVTDAETSATAIIDSVLNYDQASGRVSTISADQVISYIKDNKLKLEWILETHIHADHLTASSYIKGILGGKTGISSRIKDVLAYWVPVFNTNCDTPLDGTQFDVLFEDNHIFYLGNVAVKIWHTPGHTPACTSYLVENHVFVGDTLFMPDLGTARTDFPGGSAATMYDSIQRILSLPSDTNLYLCHDYPPVTREASYLTTVKEQKEKNQWILPAVSKENYIVARNQRDATLPVPKLLLPSIQVNLRLGSFGRYEANGVQYVKIPINKI